MVLKVSLHFISMTKKELQPCCRETVRLAIAWHRTIFSLRLLDWNRLVRPFVILGHQQCHLFFSVCF